MNRREALESLGVLCALAVTTSVSSEAARYCTERAAKETIHEARMRRMLTDAGVHDLYRGKASGDAWCFTTERHRIGDGLCALVAEHVDHVR